MFQARIVLGNVNVTRQEFVVAKVVGCSSRTSLDSYHSTVDVLCIHLSHL